LPGRTFAPTPKASLLSDGGLCGGPADRSPISSKGVTATDPDKHVETLRRVPARTIARAALATCAIAPSRVGIVGAERVQIVKAVAGDVAASAWQQRRRTAALSCSRVKAAGTAGARPRRRSGSAKTRASTGSAVPADMRPRRRSAQRWCRGLVRPGDPAAPGGGRVRNSAGNVPRSRRPGISLRIQLCARTSNRFGVLRGGFFPPRTCPRSAFVRPRAASCLRIAARPFS
jgi:hypothetical protein